MGRGVLRTRAPRLVAALRGSPDGVRVEHARWCVQSQMGTSASSPTDLDPAPLDSCEWSSQPPAPTVSEMGLPTPGDGGGQGGSVGVASAGVADGAECGGAGAEI